MQTVPSRKSAARHRWPYPTASSAGNNVLFLHDATSGPKSFNLRPDTRARAIIGPFQGALRNEDLRGRRWHDIRVRPEKRLVLKLPLT
ncbi:MAG: hypothetical protein IJT83_08500 [Victivallales bacterium]|nr:hypothetical protein [Victivallales bacterium]